MKRILAIAGVALASLALSACELAPKTSTQNGYRGTGMDTIISSRTDRSCRSAN